MESELGRLTLKDDLEGHNTARNLLIELADCVVDFQTGVSNSKQQVQQVGFPQSNLEPGCSCSMGGPSSLSNSFSEIDVNRASCYADMPVGVGASRLGANGVAMEGPSDEGSCYHLNNNSWLARDQSRQCSSMNSSTSELMPNDWGRCGMPSLSWGGRVVGRRQLKGYAKGNFAVGGEEYEAFVNIFEGGSLLYCNMSFEALLNVRKQLEELGFPCKAVNDGLWLQVSFCLTVFFSSFACFCYSRYMLMEFGGNRNSHNYSYFCLILCLWRTKTWCHLLSTLTVIVHHLEKSLINHSSHKLILS